MAVFDDGRTMVYGNMGGDGQPQTQSAVFTRYALFGMNPQAAVSAPRWLLGRTWGQVSDTLKLEARFPAEDRENAANATATRWKCCRPGTRPWAMPARSCAMPTACSKAAPTRAPDGAVAAYLDAPPLRRTRREATHF